MPTTFTHDLFGKEVYRKLQKEIQHIIKAHGDLYRIGLHGPDILFYYGVIPNHVTKTGSAYHRALAKPFFERGTALVRRTKDSALLAYLLGFACHFMLDSTCHPYINAITDSVSHGEIEIEWDRKLMIREGINPYHFYPSDCIRPKMEYAKTIGAMFPEVSPSKIYISLKLMKKLTNLMVYDDCGRKQRILFPIMKCLGIYDSFGGNFMRKDCDPVCVPFLEKLQNLYEKALDDTPVIVKNLWDASYEEKELTTRFARNYE